MTTSLLFSQVPYQTQPPDIERGMMGVSVQNRSAVAKTYDESSGDSRESFLNTLEQISKDNPPNKPTQGAGGGKSSKPPAYNSGDKFDATSRPATGLEIGISGATKQLEEDLDNLESQITSASNLTVVISILEKLGLYDPAGGSSSANKVDGILGHIEGLTALTMRIARLGHNDLMSSAEMKAVLDRLQQFIAKAQTGNASAHNDGHPLGELTDSRSAEPADLNQLMKKIVSGQEDQRGSSGIHMWESDSGKKTSDPFTKMNRVATTSPNDIRQTGSFQFAENSQAASRSENGEKTDSIKLAVEARPVGIEASENAKEPRPLENESSPVSKMIHDAQLAKESHMRMNAAMSDEFGGKITKVDAGTNDNGLLSSQNQTADKAFEATSPFRQTDTGQDSLRIQTLDQIVRKAVMFVRNGHHEAKIDLKPEFLGHVRMQVITENHQVTVKILTESGFVKDMVENNIHQLKADLQQQGLNVDKLEVAVSNDSDESKHPQEKADQAKDRQRSHAGTNPGNRKGETREQAGNFGLRKAGTTTVDYFA